MLSHTARGRRWNKKILLPKKSKIVLLNRSIHFIRWCHKWMCKRTASDFIARRLLQHAVRERKGRATAHCLPELSTSSSAFLLNSSQLMHKSITEKQISLTIPAHHHHHPSIASIMRCWGVVNLHVSNFFRIYYLLKCSTVARYDI